VVDDRDFTGTSKPHTSEGKTKEGRRRMHGGRQPCKRWRLNKNTDRKATGNHLSILLKPMTQMLKVDNNVNHSTQSTEETEDALDNHQQQTTLNSRNRWPTSAATNSLAEGVRRTQLSLRTRLYTFKFTWLLLWFCKIGREMEWNDANLSVQQLGFNCACCDGSVGGG